MEEEEEEEEEHVSLLPVPDPRPGLALFETKVVDAILGFRRRERHNLEGNHVELPVEAEMVEVAAPHPRPKGEVLFLLALAVSQEETEAQTEVSGSVDEVVEMLDESVCGVAVREAVGLPSRRQVKTAVETVDEGV